MPKAETGPKAAPARGPQPQYQKAKASLRTNKPTKLELLEGLSYKAMLENPTDEALRIVHVHAWNALQAAQTKNISVFRCAACKVTAYGRIAGDECGACGAVLLRYHASEQEIAKLVNAAKKEAEKC